MPSLGNNTFLALADIEELKCSILNVLRAGSSLSEATTNKLSLLDSQIPLYDAEISRVEGVLVALKASKTAIRNCMCLQQSSASPIRTLPVEILTAIFEDACCASSAGSEPFIPPTVLTSVCSHWRKVCLSRPILWTHITACHRIRPDNSSLIARRVDHYRSLPEPLSLTFHVTASYEKADYDKRFPGDSGTDAICNAIAVPSVLDRCHSICFTTNSRGRSIFNTITSQFPLLRSLEVRSVESGTGIQRPWAMCRNASNVDCLHMHGLISSLQMQLPSPDQITTLFLSEHRSSLIKRFPKAITATLVDCLSSSSLYNFSSEGPIPLMLESLTLNNTLLEPLIRDSSFSLPRLSSLEIVPKPHSYSTAPTFRDDLHNSLRQLCQLSIPSPITSLTLTEVPFTDAEVRRMLKYIPHLKNLSIVEANERGPNCSPIISTRLVTYLYEPAELDSLKLVWAPSVDNTFPSLDHYKENIVMDMIEHHAHVGSIESIVVGLRNGVELSTYTAERLGRLRNWKINATQW